MNETDVEVETDAPGANGQVATEARKERSSIDLSNRPTTAWLDAVQAELNDTDLVLKCLARDSAKICQTCDAVQKAGELDSRPMLARCASTKQPR